MFFKLLSSLDLFKVHFFFKFNGKAKISSPLGIFFSFIIIIFGFLQFFNSEFFKKSSPAVVIQSLSLPYAQRIDFNKENPLIINIRDPNTVKPFIDASIFTVVAVFIQNKAIENREMHFCKFEDLPYNKSYFDHMQFNQSYCLKDNSFNIVGSDP